MRKLVAFNHVTLDGFFADANRDMSWANPDHKVADVRQWQRFAVLRADGVKQEHKAVKFDTSKFRNPKTKVMTDETNR